MAEIAYTVKSATYGSPISGVDNARITHNITARVDPGSAAHVGRQGSAGTFEEIAVELYGRDYAALLALIGTTAANVVITYAGENGATETATIKNVVFVQPIGDIVIPARDSGGATQPTIGIRGVAIWEDTDTAATMWS